MLIRQSNPKKEIPQCAEVTAAEVYYRLCTLLRDNPQIEGINTLKNIFQLDYATGKLTAEQITPKMEQRDWLLTHTTMTGILAGHDRYVQMLQMLFRSFAQFCPDMYDFDNDDRFEVIATEMETHGHKNADFRLIMPSPKSQRLKFSARDDTIAYRRDKDGYIQFIHDCIYLLMPTHKGFTVHETLLRCKFINTSKSPIWSDPDRMCVFIQMDSPLGQSAFCQIFAQFCKEVFDYEAIIVKPTAHNYAIIYAESPHV